MNSGAGPWPARVPRTRSSRPTIQQRLGLRIFHLRVLQCDHGLIAPFALIDKDSPQNEVGLKCEFLKLHSLARDSFGLRVPLLAAEHCGQIRESEYVLRVRLR